MSNNAVEMAWRLAQSKSRHHQHRHAVLVMVGKRIVGAGWNAENRHAEMMALLHARDEAYGADALSIRIRKSGHLGMARPCANCMAALKRAGVRRVQYSINSGELITESIQEE